MAAEVACRAAGFLSLLLLAGPLSARTAWAQDLAPLPEDNEPEPFSPADPYTQGERAALDRLGYKSFGPFTLPGGTSTSEATEILGGVPILWVETAHFKLGSSLKTYRLRGDAEEGRKLEAELARLRQRLGRLKSSRNQLDPWLRLHLYAQRLEELYAAFCQAFALSELAFGPPATDMGLGPHLGQKEKFLVLLLEKKASLGRYTRIYLGAEQTISNRAFLPGGGMLYAVSAESMREGGLELDAVLQSYLAFSLVCNFCDGFRQSWSAVPVWFKYGLGHHFARAIDARWPVYEGIGEQREGREDAWKWEPRVRGLVENEVFPAWEGMLAWRDPGDLDRRAHMIAWSRVEWLLQREGGDPRAFLMEVGAPLPPHSSELSTEEHLARQLAGLQAAWGAGPAALQEEWVRYVRRSYPRK